MIKKIIFSFFFFFTINLIYSQDKLAEIKFKETIIDYGIIEHGEDGSKIFEFTNTGNAPLVFTRIFSSCGCTIPKKPEEPILPGESGEIQELKVRFFQNLTKKRKKKIKTNKYKF